MTSKTKFMQLPRAVLVGRDAISSVEEMCTGLKLEGDALVVSGSNTYKIAAKKVCDILEESRDIEVVKIREASLEETERVKSLALKRKVGFIVGAGGGKVIDAAKLASKEIDVDFLSIPTAASHDGIASALASVKRDNNTVSLLAHAPLGVIADTGIISKAPYRLTASGCGDIIAKFTAVKDWRLASRVRGEEYSEYASALSLMTAKIIVNSCNVIRKAREEGIRRVVKALISSGVAMSIAGSSRPGSGSEHNFSHALNKIAPSPALHGEQCGVGAIMMMYLHRGDWKKIRETLKRIGAPTNAHELGIREKYIVEALTKAHEIRRERYTILGRGLNEAKARKVAAATGVI